jgi:hypothetical protein
MDVKGKTKDNIKAIMDIMLFYHRKNMELVYAGSQVAKPKASFTLNKNAQLLVYQWFKVCVFPMDMPRTYQGWLIWRIADCMEWRAMTATCFCKHSFH